MFAVALAVAAIPEALSSDRDDRNFFSARRRWQRTRDHPKTAGSRGTGSVSIICSDKNRQFLTQKKMTVEDYYVNESRIPADKIDPKDDDVRLLLVSSILCNDSTNVDGVEVGDPTETALINLGSKIGVEAQDVRERLPRESENPFDSDRKLMATKHTIEGRHHDRQRCG